MLMKVSSWFANIYVPMIIVVIKKALTSCLLIQVSNLVLSVLLMFVNLSAPTVLVKFGDDPDLQEEECHMLLNKYMPEHVTRSKVLQRLFIRYTKILIVCSSDYPYELCNLQVYGKEV